MFSAFAFLLTSLEMGIVILGYAIHSQPIFSNMVVYGSPFYMAMNLFGSNSLLADYNPLYIGFALFHIIKYVTIFRAQMVDDSNMLRHMAVLFEVIYLALSGYYLF